jgi:uncharacterized protein (DUF1697 family)
MSQRVAFLRAVNVGRRTVKMDRLRAAVESLGYEGVFTYINSGNVGFAATGGRDTLERKLENTFEAEFGFEVTTFVRSAAELRRAVAAEPSTVAAGDTYFVTFLKRPPTAAGKRALEALSNDFDTLVVRGRDVHWRMRGKSTDSSLATKDWETIIGRHTSTSRNVTMLRKLVDRLD